MYRRRPSSFTWTDLFCGAGGASSGLVEAGAEIVLAANHWATAIETHSANHPGTEHLCEDINRLNMRRLPSTTGLWASVICTEISPAGGRKRNRGQLELLEYGSIPVEAFEVTRATALDVIRATEVHRYDLVVVENVPAFATDWALFGWWRDGMHLLGYRSQIISVSSAHVGDDSNDAAAQWRNRIYIVFTRDGVPVPDLTPRPLAWCEPCGEDVRARQSWNPGRSIGEYRKQYRYVCPNSACRHADVEPYIRPASTAIDWSDIGQRIGDRVKPLAARTMGKIVDGYRTYMAEPSLITVNHGGDSSRAIPARFAPFPTRTVKIGDGLVVPPGAFITELRGGGSTHRPVSHPLATVSAGGNHHGLVIPYRRGSKAYPAGQPFHAMSTKVSGGLLQAERLEQPIGVDDLHFRMLKPREQLNAQRFPGDYIVHGNVAEQTMQAGNAVSVNVARWIGEQAMAAMGGAA